MITYQTIPEQTAQMERLAPIRERAFQNLSTLYKKRIDSKTVVLVKSTPVETSYMTSHKNK